ncbi:MAG: NusG domain II-containing protein [Aristaeellaceae bacterium]
MKQKRLNLLVALSAVLVIVLVGALSLLPRKELNPTLGALAADVTEAPTATQVPEATAQTDAAAVREPARAYLVVTVQGAMYEPIPLYAAGRYTITQGEDMVNVIEVTEDSMRMLSSTCDNQDCVEQGVVSLDNRDARVLRNMVICLPHEVTLELYTPEEIAQLLLYMAGYTGEEDNE